MHCEEAESLLGQLVLSEKGDDLEPEVRKELRAHVKKCAKCRELAGDMRVAAKLLTEGVHAGPEPKLSPERKKGLEAEAARPTKAMARAGARRSRWIRWLGAAAAAVLIFGVAASLVLPVRLAARKARVSTTDVVIPMDLQQAPAEEEYEVPAERNYLGIRRRGGRRILGKEEPLEEAEPSAAPSGEGGEWDDDGRRAFAFRKESKAKQEKGAAMRAPRPARTPSPAAPESRRAEQKPRVRAKTRRAGRRAEGLRRGVAQLDAVKSEDLVEQWKLDETSGRTAADTFGQGHIGPGGSTGKTLDDKAGITVRPRIGVVTTEAGGIATRTVVLADREAGAGADYGPRSGAAPRGEREPVVVGAGATAGKPKLRIYDVRDLSDTITNFPGPELVEAAAVPMLEPMEHQAPGRPPEPEREPVRPGRPPPPPPPPGRPPRDFAGPALVRPDVPDRRRAKDRLAKVRRELVRRKAEAKGDKSAAAGEDGTPRHEWRGTMTIFEKAPAPKPTRAELKAKAAEFAEVHGRTAKLKTSASKVAEYQKALPQFRGTKYEKQITNLLRREKDALLKGSYAQVRAATRKAKTREARVRQLTKALDDFEGSSYHARLAKMIRRDKDALLKGDYSEVASQVRRKQGWERLDYLAGQVRKFEGSSYHAKLEKMVEAERKRLRVEGAESARRGEETLQAADEYEWWVRSTADVQEAALSPRALAALQLAEARKAYDKLDYERALKLSEAAAKVDPSNENAKELVRFTRSILGIRFDMVGVDLEQFAQQKRVNIQESLMELQWTMDSAKRDMEVADKLRAGGNTQDAARLYGKTREKFARAAEIEKWMPYQVDLRKESAQIADGLRRASVGKEDTERGAIRNILEEASIPYSEVIEYPQDWERVDDVDDVERVWVNKKLVELDTLLRRAKKSLPLSLRQSVEPSLDYQVRLYSRGLRDAKRAQEIIKWMPSDVKIDDKKEEAEKLVAEARKARDEALARLGVDLGIEVAQLKKEKARLEKDLHHNSWIIQKLMEQGVPVNDIIPSAETQPARPINAKVLADRPEVNLVMLSAGSQDGVKKGHRFTVYRGEQYIGKVEVEKVFDDMASARILVDWTKQPIRENDDASTSVYGGGGALPKEKKPDLSKTPRMLAAQRLVTGGKAKRAPGREQAKPQQQPAQQPAQQQFLVLSQGQAQAIEKRHEQQLKQALQAQLVQAAPVFEEPVPEPDQEDQEAASLPDAEAAARIPPPPPVNPFVMTEKDKLSTFAMDVDTASYTIARKYIRAGHRPPPGLVRMEEYVNAFDYNYPKRSRDVFDIHSAGMPSPFGKGLQLLKIGIQARIVGREGQKPAHLVFVIDTSGSMEQSDRMPLVKHALGLLVGQLAPHDLVTVVAYGTGARLVVEGVSASSQDEITSAIDSLQCAGSTNMLAGLRLGYEQAKQRFRAGAVNRVILCSDGVANVGASEAEEILKEIETYRDWGITLTVAGFGAGSYDDRMLEKLADSGDGHYIFIDSRREARRVFVEELGATLHTVAKDAKIQVEFNAERVRRYRLVGYENRDIADKDFRNDAVDAGEVGSGQSVTALYEIELFRQGRPRRPHEPAVSVPGAREDDIGTVYVRYRNRETGKIEEVSHRLRADAVASPGRPRVERAPRLYLAACVAEFAEILRGSEHAKDGDLGQVERPLARVQRRLPLDKKVRELLWLVRRAKALPRVR